jgi:hypothetical protein
MKATERPEIFLEEIYKHDRSPSISLIAGSDPTNAQRACPVSKAHLVK